MIEPVTDLPAGTIGFRASGNTDKDWVRYDASAFGWLAPGELRLFESSELDKARA